MLDKFIAKHLSEPNGISGRVVSFFMNRQNRRIYEKTVEIISIKNGESILDLGCGNGYVLNMIAQKHKGHFTGIDVSESIIASAKKRNRDYVESGKMQFDCQNLNKMGFADCTFDKAYTINTVYFWESLEDSMSEIKRVLNHNGVFYNTLFSNETLDRFSFTKNGYRKFSQEQLTKAGTNTGFDVEIVPMFNGLAYCYIYRKQE